ncbi:MAG: AMP-binding protein [Pseudomonadota bacterium]|nr:AMP-binding protein [Pseudomonadota bacterium]
MLRPLFTFLLKLCFRVEVHGMEHYHAAGDKVLIVVNHQSYLDPMFIATFLPEKPAFAVNVFQAQKWYMRLVDWMFTFYRLDPLKPMSMKQLITDLRQSARVVIFPEGRITTSGGIMKIYEGAAMIAEKTGAVILPVRIEGAEYSKVSRLGKKLHQRWFPKVRMTILPPVPPEAGADALYDVMTYAAFAVCNHRRHFLEALLEARRWHGSGHVVASDITRLNMNYRQLFAKAFVLGKALPVKDEKYVAVMLPTGLAALVTFVALQVFGKIPCMLNFSSGSANLLHACRIAGAKTVLTSRQFVEKGKLEELIEALSRNHTIVYLEDIRDRISIADKIRSLMKSLFAQAELAPVIAGANPDDPMVILYTSGSEGVPKGVALSHANILANVAQVCARLDLTPSDIVFNALPVFHSFGLSVGMLMPALKGVKTFLYPTPLHYRIISDLVYDTDATIMLGTDTFYQGYAHYAHDYDFWNVRLAVAGAEKLKESTRRLYADRFGLTIYEGYGVTEASPVIACNTPLAHRHGTVGRIFPAIECRIEKVPGLEQGGRLLVKGPNIMLGYLNPERPGEIRKQDEWYDTGDIVDIEEGGFVRILGRAKRFAKIGGEMVSLLVVEELAAGVMPEAAHAALALPDEKKGEHIVLFTESKELTREQLMRQAKEKGIADICLPKRVEFLEAIPRLGTGKVDYVTLGKTVKP